MGNFIERQQACETDAAGASGPDSEAGRPWGWSRVAPALRGLLAALGGPRPLATAKAVGAAPKACVAGLPAFFRDGVTCSLAALLAAFHVGTTCARPGQRGRPRKPRGAPHPALGDGHWVKQKPQGQRRTRRTRGVLGAERLPPLGLTLSPALLARVHVPWRPALAPWARKTSRCCTDRERLRQRVVRCQGFYPRARAHLRLQQPLPPHERPCRGAMQPRGRERPPALAAGLTEHVWTFRELLTAKVEPLDSQSLSG